MLSKEEKVAGVIAAIIAVVIAVLYFSGVGDNPKKLVGANAREVPTAVATPVLEDQLVKGEYYRVGRTALIACWERPAVLEKCNDEVAHVQPEDVVESLGDPILHRNNTTELGYWYFPIRVIQGSVYAEGYDFLVVDGQFWPSSTTLRERYKPDFKTGETVRLSYNFTLRRSPAGDPWVVDKYGNAALGYGRDEVTLVTDSVLGSDGHYYSGFNSAFIADYLGLPADTVFWVPSEFEKE